MEKVQIGETSSEDTQKTASEQDSQQANAPADQMQESLRIINEEALQLSEYVWQESKLIKELCALLKQVLKRLNMSFGLPAASLPFGGRAQRVILNEEAHLILINDKNEVTSKALDDCPPHVIFDIVSLIVPELGRSLTSHRKKISNRVNLFDKVNQELRNLGNIFVTDTSTRPEEDRRQQNDAVKKALSTQTEGHS